MRLRPPPSKPAHGYSLIEILVTLVVLLLGLLGLAGVNARASINEFESYQRIQAMALLQDMVGRLNANRMVAPCYSNGATGVQVGTADASGYTGVPGVAACTLTTDINGNAINATQKTQLVDDLQAWNNQLQGGAESDSTKAVTAVGAMVGAVGCIRQIDATNQIYLISVSWQGLADTVAPTDATATPCGRGNYGSEARHRMVTATVQIARLL